MPAQSQRASTKGLTCLGWVTTFTKEFRHHEKHWRNYTAETPRGCGCLSRSVESRGLPTRAPATSLDTHNDGRVVDSNLWNHREPCRTVRVRRLSSHIRPGTERDVNRVQTADESHLPTWFGGDSCSSPTVAVESSNLIKNDEAKIQGQAPATKYFQNGGRESRGPEKYAQAH